MARKDHVRCQFFLSRSQSERLEAAARKPGVTKSAILEEAIIAFLDRKGDAELELRFARRLDQSSKQMERIERKMQVVKECLTLFIRYVLNAVEPAPARDEAARAAGRERFNAFVKRVCEQLAGVGVNVDVGTLQ